MSYKTILVHCDAGKPFAGRLKVALDLADRQGAHLTGIYVRPRFDAPLFTDGSLAMDSVYQDYQTRVKADEAAVSALFAGALGGKARSTDWRTTEGYPDEVLAECAHAADLVVVGQRAPDPASDTPPDVADRLALLSERPVLVVPHIGAGATLGKTVLLCWNGHREAGRAATGALPILRTADTVIVLAIDPPRAAESQREKGADFVQWLTRHGVKAVLHHDSAGDTDVGDIILSRAADESVDLIVMGVYGHSRMREMVMGGASRTVLASMTVPVLMAH